MLRLYPLFALILLLSLNKITAQTDGPPNILLIIADDLGVDYSNGYHEGALMPTTPNLDSLRAVGLTFENVWSAPACAPTRAAIMSGKYGVKTGVTTVPGHLDVVHESVFEALAASTTSNEYAGALVGKWHLSQPQDPNGPALHGVDYFMGVLRGAVGDYFNWARTQDGITVTEDSYVTTEFTNDASNWINDQNQPWLMWLAHVAAHSPSHTPPDSMYTISPVNNNQQRYVAMVESLDFEIGRLLDNIPEEVLANTLVIYIGDNGTPNNLLQDYPNGHGKGSPYQGGVRAPMIVSGAGVTRPGEREPALVMVADFYATILEATGIELEGGRYNSLSFYPLLSGQEMATRDYNYVDREDDYAIRGPRYKLIQFDSGQQEFYDLLEDSLEVNNLLLTTLTAEQIAIKADLELEAGIIRTGWSCRDHIRNGDEEGIDCGGSSCTPCITSVGELRPAEVQISPNPVQDELFIRSAEQFIQELRVLNMAGQELLLLNDINQQEFSINLSTLPPQAYLLQLKMNDTLEVIKFIKE